MANRELQAEVEAAVLAELERVGPADFNRAEIFRQFEDRNVARSTVYRWVDGVLKSGRGGAHLTKVVKKAAEKRAKRSPDPAADAAREVVEEVLPPIPKPTDFGGAGVVPMVDRLSACIKVAEELMAHARTEDGKPRNAKLLLNASDHLRRSVETVVRLQEAMMQVMHVERFHEAVFQVLREEKPELVERVLLRLRQINAQYGM